MDPASTLRLARIAHPVQTLGPGRRVALWVAGCPLRCPGCITQELQSFDAGKTISIARLANHLLRLDPSLAGITFTGGEPFAQSRSLAELWRRIRIERPDWNLLAFSGYTLARLRRHSENRGLLDCVDLLIAGPYRAHLPSASPLIASTNQRIHSFGHRGNSMRQELHHAGAGSAELGLLPDGGWLIGILDPQLREKLYERLGPSANVGPNEC